MPLKHTQKQMPQIEKSDAHRRLMMNPTEDTITLMRQWIMALEMMRIMLRIRRRKMMPWLNKILECRCKVNEDDYNAGAKAKLRPSFPYPILPLSLG